MATYVGLLVASLVDDIILPVLQYIPGLKELDSLEAWALGPFMIGKFLSAVITFIIISLIMFLIVKLSKKMGFEED